MNFGRLKDPLRIRPLFNRMRQILVPEFTDDWTALVRRVNDIGEAVHDLVAGDAFNEIAVTQREIIRQVSNMYSEVNTSARSFYPGYVIGSSSSTQALADATNSIRGRYLCVQTSTPGGLLYWSRVGLHEVKLEDGLSEPDYDDILFLSETYPGMLTNVSPATDSEFAGIVQQIGYYRGSSGRSGYGMAILDIDKGEKAGE